MLCVLYLCTCLRGCLMCAVKFYSPCNACAHEGCWHLSNARTDSEELDVRQSTSRSGQRHYQRTGHERLCVSVGENGRGWSIGCLPIIDYAVSCAAPEPVWGPFWWDQSPKEHREKDNPETSRGLVGRQPSPKPGLPGARDPSRETPAYLLLSQVLLHSKVVACSTPNAVPALLDRGRGGNQEPAERDPNDCTVGAVTAGLQAPAETWLCASLRSVIVQLVAG